ncbi:MAG TPA: CARDB domain-containing protein [Solirubrobacter sp.]|nr:CARDB domain-containing protein [Solirubrobacter sp.]
MLAVLAPAAQASWYARGTLERCDRQANEAMFQGVVRSYRGAQRMQMRFTLQVRTPEERRWSRVDADGFGTWITAPAGVTKYTYDKTVEELLPGARYRAVVHFRWRNPRGRTIRWEREVSRSCRQPDTRPDLEVTDLRVVPRGYVAVVANRGRRPADGFAVDFFRAGLPLGSVDVLGLAPRATVDVFLPAPGCAPDDELLAVADPRSEVDEADETNDSLTVTC